jgi:YggT family protein
VASFIYSIISSLLWLIIMAIIASAILSWLVAFNVVNPRNDFVRMLLNFLDAVTRPFLWPVQRVIPPLGGVDISPVIVIIVLSAARSYLLPWLFGPLQAAIG